MSTTENTIWLERAMEEFQDALDDQNYPHANDIICDVRDNGFEKEAHTMLFMLRNVEFDKGHDAWEAQKEDEMLLDANQQG